MNEGWQLITAEMMDWAREAHQQGSNQGSFNEWLFTGENSSNQRGAASHSRRRRAGRARRDGGSIGVPQSAGQVSSRAR
jgi:hypothetical protein